ncbi:aminoglycoside phosphotransferase family protein [Rossellomorea vietnamensis]|uniref:aminoglycoside phosphotransferase family protein n=1 Tax=Rossellomorea vietnamensis TaxID=218284 RepID=UPI003D29D38C
MGDTKYYLDFKEMCRTSLLGELVSKPKLLTGGLLHRMFAVETTQGKYAIKLLNPEIMKRPTAFQKYLNSEKVSNFVSNFVPAISAEKINEDFIQRVNDQYYLVFKWLDGETLRQINIDNRHCEEIGRILADIHMTDFSSLGITNEINDKNHIIDWDYYLEKGKDERLEWVEILLENIDNLKKWNSIATEANQVLALNMVISHRDLDPKNVMWKHYKPVLIDWESAGFINPMHDLIETALYWSTSEIGEIDKQKFFSFIRGYKERYGEVHSDWRRVLSNGLNGKLDWLEYSLKRSLWIECTDEEEHKMGTEQVTGTINEIKNYTNQIPKLLNWLNKEL